MAEKFTVKIIDTKTNEKEVKEFESFERAIGLARMIKMFNSCKLVEVKNEKGEILF